MATSTQIGTGNYSGFAPRKTIVLTPGNAYGQLAHAQWAKNPSNNYYEQLTLIYSSDKGGTWSSTLISDLSSEQVGGNPATSVDNIGIACHPTTGAIHIVAACKNRSSSPNRLYHFTNASGSWVKTQLSSDLNLLGYVSTMVFTADNILHMVYYGKRTNADSDAKLWYSKYSAGSWTLWDSEITTTGYSDPSICVSAYIDNSIVVGGAVYFSSPNRAIPAFIIRQSNGTWGSWQYSDYLSQEIKEISMSVDPTTHDLYFLGRSSDYTKTVALRYQYGVGWDNSFAVTLKQDNNGNAYSGAISVDRDGVIYAAYLWFDPGHSYDALLYLKEYSNSTWSAETSLVGYLNSPTGLYFITDYYSPSRRKYAVVYDAYDVGQDALVQKFYSPDGTIWDWENIYTQYSNVYGISDEQPSVTLVINGIDTSPWGTTNLFPSPKTVSIGYQKLEIENAVSRAISNLIISPTCSSGTLTVAEGSNGDTFQDVSGYTFSSSITIASIAQSGKATVWFKWDMGGPIVDGSVKYDIHFREF